MSEWMKFSEDPKIYRDTFGACEIWLCRSGHRGAGYQEREGDGQGTRALGCDPVVLRERRGSLSIVSWQVKYGHQEKEAGFRAMAYTFPLISDSGQLEPRGNVSEGPGRKHGCSISSSGKGGGWASSGLTSGIGEQPDVPVRIGTGELQQCSGGTVVTSPRQSPQVVIAVRAAGWAQVPSSCWCCCPSRGRCSQLRLRVLSVVLAAGEGSALQSMLVTIFCRVGEAGTRPPDLTPFLTRHFHDPTIIFFKLLFI